MTDWDNDGVDNDESGEGIIELTDIVMDEPDSGVEEDIIELTDIVENQGMDLNLDSVRVDADEETEDLPFSLTSEQVEAALEKVIERQSADKIETILFQVIEKVIEREITGIRESLQKDLDQIENA